MSEPEEAVRPSTRRTRRAKSGLPPVGRQGREYVDRVLWLAMDVLKSSWARVIVVTLINLFGITAAAATIGGIVLYARQMESGETDRLWGLDVGLTDPDVFWLFAGTVGVLGVVAAFSIYAAEWFISRITVDYQKKCTRRLFEIVADPDCRGWPDLLEGPARQAILQLSGVSVRITAFAARNLLRSILPIATFAVATTALILVDPVLTGLLAPAVVLYLVPLYLLNRGVARQHRTFRSLSPQLRALMNEGWHLHLQMDAPREEKAEWVERALDREEYHRVQSLFWKRKLADNRVQVLNTAFFVLCLLGLFVFFALTTPTTDRTWSDFLAYVIALRFALHGVRQVTSRFIMLSRFLPEFEAYSDFLRAAETMRQCRCAAPARGQPLPETFVVRTHRNPNWESEPRLRLRRGGPVLVITEERPIRVLLEAIISRIESRARNDADLAARAIVPTPTDFETPLPAGDVYVLDLETLHALVEHDSAAIEHTLAASFTFIVTDATSNLTEELEAAAPVPIDDVMVMIEKRIVGCGDAAWYREHAEEIAAALEQAKPAPPAFDDDLDEALDLEEV